MKKMKKVIAVVAAASMVLTSCITASAKLIIGGVQYPDALNSIEPNTEIDTTVKTHPMDSIPDAYFKVELSGNGYVQVRPTFHCNGEKAILINGNGGSAKLHLVFNKQAPDNEYHISFNMLRDVNAEGTATVNRDNDDYATLNDYNLSNNAKFNTYPGIWGAGWVCVEEPNDEHQWRHYEATVTQYDATPELNFGAFNWGQVKLDDIVVKDKNGNILYSEDFEGDSRLSTADTNQKIAAGTYVMTTSNKRYYINKTAGGYVKIRDNISCNGGTRAALIVSNGGENDYTEFHLAFDTQAPGDEYHISFNRLDPGNFHFWRDYATLNSYQKDASARFEDANTIWTKTLVENPAKGGTWYHYETVITEHNNVPEIVFAAYGTGQVKVDDILVKDKNGNTLFFEDFEGDDGMLPSKWTYSKVSGTKPATFTEKEQTGVPTNHVLKVTGYNAGLGMYYINLPHLPDNIYNISYEVKSVTDRSLSIGTEDDIYSAAQIGNSGTVTRQWNSSGETRLKIRAEGYAGAEIDNIVIKDKNGNIVFSEDFESHSYEVEYPKLTISGEEETKLNTGKVTVSSKLINNFENSPLTAYFIVAAYNGNETELRRVKSFSATAAKGEKKDLSVEIDVLSDEHLKVFWWDNPYDINSYRTSVIYTR